LKIDLPSDLIPQPFSRRTGRRELFCFVLFFNCVGYEYLAPKGGLPPHGGLRTAPRRTGAVGSAAERFSLLLSFVATDKRKKEK